MKILLLGATGYLGSAAVRHLADAGHTVVALARPGGFLPTPEGIAEVRYGDLADAASLTRSVSRDVDAVVNLATPTGDEATDRAATEALLDPLRGTGRAFIYVSGTWVLGRTVTTATEQSRPDPIAIVGYRPAIEQQVIAAAQQGVRGVVVRPGVVHGHHPRSSKPRPGQGEGGGRAGIRRGPGCRSGSARRMIRPRLPQSYTASPTPPPGTHTPRRSTEPGGDSRR